MNKRIAYLVLAACWLLSSTAHAMCKNVLAYADGSVGWHYDNKRVAEADPKSFHVLTGLGSEIYYNPCMRDSGYAADKLHVYKGAYTIPNADPASFSFLADGYSRDATHIFYMGTILDGADARTFKQISRGFFMDSVHVYLNGAVIEDANPVTFRPLGNNPYPGTGLARDAKHVFFGASAVLAANSTDVEPLGRQYWVSNRTIFFAGKPLAHVDSVTFHIAGDDELAFSAEDSEHYFLGDQALNKSACRKVGEIVLACKNYVLARGHKYSQIDAPSLHYLSRFPQMCQVIENSMIYQDDYGIYEFFGDGTIMKFLSFQPDRKFERLDKTLKDLLCDHPITQSLNMDQ